jgi:MFS superfamily sulfate permease-like transporter
LWSVISDIGDWAWAAVAIGVGSLVGFSEGWGASKQIAKKTHDDLQTDQEFRAYGAGNIGAGLLGGMVVTGSLGKSAAAEEAGAESQMTSIMLAGVVEEVGEQRIFDTIHEAVTAVEHPAAPSTEP